MHLPSLDMPHWARFAVNATRQKLALPAAITDRQIYATLQAGGFNVAASERRLADAAQDIALRALNRVADRDTISHNQKEPSNANAK